MNAVAKIKPEVEVDALAKLREPFPPHLISKLPKPTKAQTDAVSADYKKGVRCQLCGSWHHPDVVHLDYVGHAALTDRLLDTDPHWTWEPLAYHDGLPAFDATGGLWIKLTVCGMTRLGYGHAKAKNADPGSREKEVIGDALRNAAMRFGAALDLWHKGDLHGPSETDEREEPVPERDAADLACNVLEGCADPGLFKECWSKNAKHWNEVMNDDQWNRVVACKKRMVEKFVTQAEAEKAKEQPPTAALPAQVDPFDDEIPEFR